MPREIEYQVVRADKPSWIKRDSDKFWTTKQYEPSATLDILLDQPTSLSSIQIVNNGSAFIEVSVGNIPQDMDENGDNEFPRDMFQIIVPQSQLMGPKGKRDLLKALELTKSFPVRSAKWEVIRFKISQPFDQTHPYGLTGIILEGCTDGEYKKLYGTGNHNPKSPEARKDIQALALDINIQNTEDKNQSPGLFFQKDLLSTIRKPQPKSTPPKPSGEITAEQLARMQKNREAALQRLSKSNNINGNENIPPSKSQNTPPLNNHNNNNQQPKPKVDTPVRTLTLEDDNDIVDLTNHPKPKNSPAKPNGLKRSIDDLDINTKSNQTKRPALSRGMTIAVPPSASNRNLQNSQDSQSDAESNKKPLLQKSKTETMVPFSKLMTDVVFSISGIQNPERSAIRDKGVSMGATYSNDWVPGYCTHVIAVFMKAPKVDQAKLDNGIIVTKQWLLDCHEQRKRLPENLYFLQKTPSKSGSSSFSSQDFGSFDDTFVPTPTTNSVKKQHSVTFSPKKPNTIIIDDDMIEDEVQLKNPKAMPLQSVTNKQPTPASNQSGSTNKKWEKKETQLPEFFAEKSFCILSNDIPHDLEQLIERYCIAYGGKIVGRIDKAEQLLTDETPCDPATLSHVIVGPNTRWNQDLQHLYNGYPFIKILNCKLIFECHNLKKLVDEEKFTLKPPQ